MTERKKRPKPEGFSRNGTDIYECHTDEEIRVALYFQALKEYNESRDLCQEYFKELLRICHASDCGVKIHGILISSGDYCFSLIAKDADVKMVRDTLKNTDVNKMLERLEKIQKKRQEKD